MRPGLPSQTVLCVARRNQRKKEVGCMAKTKAGKKIVPVKPYVRKNPDGSKTTVKRHRRSTPN